MIEGLAKGKERGYMKSIPPNPELDKPDKKSMAYKYQLKKLQSITCFNQATQMMCYELEGCMLIERYCDTCTSKINFD